MKRIIIIIGILGPLLGLAQSQDSVEQYKRRVLENTEISIISSYYQQDGDHAAVTGGIGTESLSDGAGKIKISIPLNADDVLNIDGKVSVYTSASSGNLNPFQTSASENVAFEGSPWVASSGASETDELKSLNLSYSHSSDDRNSIWSANINGSHEWDFRSFGIGGGYTKLFNEKNTEISINASAQLGEWMAEYPVEIVDYLENGDDLDGGIFEQADILTSEGFIAWPGSSDIWAPKYNDLISQSQRHTYSGSLAFSQILSKRAQFSLVSDLIYQTGWLGNPMQRVYFSDKNNYFMGKADDIPIYTRSSNSSVFQLADDIERLPTKRYKFPIAARFNYYINEFLVARTYYRFYTDTWGVTAHTANIEIPVKIHLGIGQRFTIYPSYRFYTQSAANYFKPFDQHLSTATYYTSDYDLSKFNSNQYGFGIKYTDVLTKIHISKLSIKEISLNYAHYRRNTGFRANIISLNLSFIIK